MCATCGREWAQHSLYNSPTTFLQLGHFVRQPLIASVDGNCRLHVSWSCTKNKNVSQPICNPSKPMFVHNQTVCDLNHGESERHDVQFRRQTAVLTVELRGRPMAKHPPPPPPFAVSRTDADGVSRRRLVMKIADTITFHGTGLFSCSRLKAHAIISAAVLRCLHVIPKAMEAVLFGLDPILT